MERRKKLIGLMTFALLGISLFCLPLNSYAAPEQKELKVGALFPLSGVAAIWGIGYKVGFEIAVDEINAAGGIKTSKAIYKLKLAAEDDEYKGTVGVTKLNKLLNQDRIDPFVLTLAATTTKAIQPITEPKKILVLYGGQADYEPDKNPYSFRIITYHYQHQQVTFEYFRKNLPNLQRVTILNPDFSAGRDQVRVFRQIAKQTNFTIAEENYYPMTTTDFTPILTKLLTKKPDLLHLGTAAPGFCALIVKQARELGFKGPFYASTKQDQAAIMKVAGEYANDFYSNSLVPHAPGISKEYNDFYSEVMKRQGQWLDVAPTQHRVAHEIKAAVEAADGLDPEKLKEAYKKIKMNSIEGPVFYGQPYGTQAYYPVAMTKIEKGKSVLLGLHDPKVITPEEYHWKPEGSY